MASIKPATRYTNSLNSSTKSDPSSSAEFTSTRETSRALTKKINAAGAAQFNISSMVKKLVENKKSKNFSMDTKFVVAADFLADDLKRNAKRDTGLSGLHKKLFKGSSSLSAGVKKGEDGSRKALTEVKENTRTLAMVLRSERELLSLNKEQEQKIQEIKLLLEEKNLEVENLKDLCLKQREEIKSLKNAILFPDVTNSELQVLEKQDPELKQAKQLIPSLQRQITSLTGQLQCLAEDLAEVKVNKYSLQRLSDHFSFPRTPSDDQEDPANYLFDQDFSSGDYTTPQPLDDMFLKDLNPCLTPCYSKTKSKEFGVIDSPERSLSKHDPQTYQQSGVIDSPERSLSKHNPQTSLQSGFVTRAMKLSKSSECCQSSKAGNGLIRTARRSGESKIIYRKQMHHKLC